MPEEKTRIPVFASNITGNPHGFDRNTLCGKIFVMLICYINKTKIPKNTEELSEIYYNNNLLIDDISNMVLCKNIECFVEKNKILVCTYGQVKLAGIVLLNLMVEAGYKLYYSGDIDPEGIQIADKLKSRYKNNIDFIGFDKDTYHNNISDIILSKSRIQKLENIKSEDLKEIVYEIKKIKKVTYEEKNIKNIIKFIEQ